MKNKTFITVFSPINRPVYNIDWATLNEFNAINPDTTVPPQTVTITGVTTFNKAQTLKLLKWFAFGTVINDVVNPNSIEPWRYTTTTHPTPKYFEYCRLYSKHNTEDTTIDAYNAWQKNRMYAHNDIAITTLVELYADLSIALPQYTFYSPFSGELYNLFTNIMEQKHRQKPSITEEQYAFVNRYAKYYDITIEEETITEHLALVDTPQGWQKWETFYTVDTYEILPAYSYMGKKSNTTHYKHHTKINQTPESVLKAYEQIKYFKSLDITLQKEFLKHSADICPHCKEPYYVADGCLCGHIAPQELPIHLNYIENINYQESY